MLLSFKFKLNWCKTVSNWQYFFFLVWTACICYPGTNCPSDPLFSFFSRWQTFTTEDKKCILSVFLQIQSYSTSTLQYREPCRIVALLMSSSTLIHPPSYCIKKVNTCMDKFSSSARVKMLLCALAEGLLLDFFCPEGNKAGKVTAHRNENETSRPTMPHLPMSTYLYPTISHSPPDHLQISYVSQHVGKKNKTVWVALEVEGWILSLACQKSSCKGRSQEIPHFPLGIIKSVLQVKAFKWPTLYEKR